MSAATAGAAGAGAVTVVNSYRRRARFCRAETAAVRRPRLLRGLLGTARHVAEIPSGTGHFLTNYAEAGAAVTFVDACPDMLAAAAEHATAAGLPAERVRTVLSTVQRLAPLAAKLVVVPNGALNQLVLQSPAQRLLTRMCSMLPPNVEVLAQVACLHPGGGVDNSTFYDPRGQHGRWFADRRFDPAQVAGAALRYRRQYRDGEQLRIEFDYRDSAGERLHTAMVELALLSARELGDVFTAAGFVNVRFLPGQGGLSELLATTPAGSRR